MRDLQTIYRETIATERELEKELKDKARDLKLIRQTRELLEKSINRKQDKDNNHRSYLPPTNVPIDQKELFKNVLQGESEGLTIKEITQLAREQGFTQSSSTVINRMRAMEEVEEMTGPGATRFRLKS